MIANLDSELALVPYNGQGPTTEVLYIMKRLVSQCSKYTYITENLSFLLWIYDSYGIKDLILD